MSLPKNLTYNIILSLSQVLFPLITIPYISRVLDPGGVGNVGFIDSFTFFFMGIAEFGIITYGIREIAKIDHDSEKLNKLSSELISLQLVTTAFTLIFYLFGIYLFWDKIKDPRLSIISAIVFLTNSFYCEWYFWGRQRFKYIAIRSIIIRITGILMIFLFVKNKQDAYIYYLIISGSYTLMIVSNLIILFKERAISFKNINFRVHLKKLFFLNGLNLAYSILLMLDTPVLRIASNETEAGLYFFAIKIVRLSTTLISDMFFALFPRTIHLLQHKKIDVIDNNLKKSATLIALFALPLSTGLFLTADDITSIYFGVAFYPIAEILSILSIFPVLCSFQLFFNRQILLSYNKDRTVFWITILAGIFFITSSIILSFYHGAKGASLAIILAELFLLIFGLIYAIRVSNYQVLPSIGSFLQIITGCILIILFIKGMHLFKIDILFRLIFSITGSIIIYFAWMIWGIKNEMAVRIYQFGISVIKPFLTKSQQ